MLRLVERSQPGAVRHPAVLIVGLSPRQKRKPGAKLREEQCLAPDCQRRISCGDLIPDVAHGYGTRGSASTSTPRRCSIMTLVFPCMAVPFAFSINGLLDLDAKESMISWVVFDDH